MGRSKTLYQLQQFDSELDKSSKRIREIEQLINDREELNSAIKIQTDTESILTDKQKLLNKAETLVADHNIKIEQNQKKLYSGAITNHKELEDLQLESKSLQKYLSLLEERQLEAMLETDQALSVRDKAASQVEELSTSKSSSDNILAEESTTLENTILRIQEEEKSYLNKTEIPDLPTYQSLKKSLNGIAVTLMVSSSCSSCGSPIPSAIAQEARSPTKLANCPTCKRILHPG
jgi:hypothetical protein